MRAQTPVRLLLLAPALALPLHFFTMWLFGVDHDVIRMAIALALGVGMMTLMIHFDDRYNDISPGRPPYKKKVGHTSGRPSAKWALFRKQVIGRSGYSDYLIRYRLIMTPWFGIMIHKIMRPDSDPAPHDHPWSFISIMLRGGYEEEIWREARARGAWVGQTVHRRVGRVHTFGRGKYHKITSLPKGRAWTLVLCGARRASWGFLADDDKHVDWADYLADA